LAEALEEARKAPKPVRIVVEPGLHPIMEPIALGKDDSQVTWSGKNAVFMAGKPIIGWVKDGAMWKAVLPDKTWKFEQLWINGRRATLARSPNKGYHHITEAVGVHVGLIVVRERGAVTLPYALQQHPHLSILV
jgi:hypothetical protein